MFFGRTRELGILQKHWESSSPECIVLYGRRRVGKTALINEFVKGRKTVFFPALQAPAGENLAALSRAIAACNGAGAVPVYQSYDDAFQAITDMAKGERIIFVIDELPYLADAEPSVLSRLQHLMDHDWADSGIFLLLCGSSMSFMEKQVLSDKSPLFGRRTGQIRLEPLTFAEAALFHPEADAAENALIYGITGGVPHYINKLAVHGSLKEALLTNFFDPSAYLYEEPANLLRQELREPAVYNAIISAIANGASRISEIASKLQMDTSQVNKYVKVLVELGILIKVEPVAGPSKRKVIYRIKDNLFRFWYRFVPPNMVPIQSGYMDKIYDRAVESALNDYMGLIFEFMAREWLLEHMDQLAFPLRQIGEWWGTLPNEHREAQLDVVGIGVKGQNEPAAEKYLIGSCKYRNAPIGPDELELIVSYAGAFSTAQDTCDYWIFSKGGFEPTLRQAEKEGRVHLVSLEEMYGNSAGSSAHRD